MSCLTLRTSGTPRGPQRTPPRHGTLKRVGHFPYPVHPHRARPCCAATPADPAARSSWRAWAWAPRRWRGTCPSGRWRPWAASRARSRACCSAPPRARRPTRAPCRAGPAALRAPPGRACTCGLSRPHSGMPGRVHSNNLGFSCVVLGGLGASRLTGRLSMWWVRRAGLGQRTLLIPPRRRVQGRGQRRPGAAGRGRPAANGRAQPVRGRLRRRGRDGWRLAPPAAAARSAPARRAAPLAGR